MGVGAPPPDQPGQHQPLIVQGDAYRLDALEEGQGTRVVAGFFVILGLLVEGQRQQALIVVGGSDVLGTQGGAQRLVTAAQQVQYGSQPDLGQPLAGFIGLG